MIERFIKTKRKSEPTDIEISYRGQQVFKSFVKTPVTPDDILHIQSLHGYDIASWVLFQVYKNREDFKSFQHFVEMQRDVYSKLNTDYTILTLCHSPWESQVKNTDYQWHMKNIAADAGFSFSYPEVPYRASLYEAVAYYRDILARLNDKKVILLTHGLSTLEMRVLLDKQPHENILGWINIAGLAHGTALAPSSEDKVMAFARYMNNEYPVSPEVARTTPYAARRMHSADYGFPIISMLGFSPLKAMNPAEQKRSEDIQHWGPHDTYCSHLDYLRDAHLIWPVWGEGHFIHTDSYKKRLQAALKWMILQDM